MKQNGGNLGVATMCMVRPRHFYRLRTRLSVRDGAGAQCHGFCFWNFSIFFQQILQEAELNVTRAYHILVPQYRVFNVARHSETEEEVVFYQALYGDYGFWVRPLSMFLESVEVDGEQVPRFALVQVEPSLFSGQ